MGIVHSCREHAAQIAISAGSVCEATFPFSPREECIEEGVPQVLVITSPHGQQTCSGEYTLVEDLMPNGEPLWRKAGVDASRDKWLYTSIGGTWNVGGRKAEEQKFNCHFAHIISEHPHNGMMPHNIRSWQWTDGHAFYTDPTITVVATEQYPSTERAYQKNDDNSNHNHPWHDWVKDLTMVSLSSPGSLRERYDGTTIWWSEWMQSGTDWIPGVFHPSAPSSLRPAMNSNLFEGPPLTTPRTHPAGVPLREFAPRGRLPPPLPVGEEGPGRNTLESRRPKPINSTPKTMAPPQPSATSQISAETLSRRLTQVQAQREHAERHAMVQKERAERKATNRSMRQQIPSDFSTNPFGGFDSGADSDEYPEICAQDIIVTNGEPSLEMTFWKSFREKDKELKFTFTARPLGMEFERGKTPVIVKACARKSVAAGLGVKKGMVFSTIEGLDVTNINYDEFYTLLTEKSMKLHSLPAG